MFEESYIARYVIDVNRAYLAGNATEHTYRPALQRLLESLAAAQSNSQLKRLQFTNEPKLIDCGRPDFIVTRGDTRVGYIEAKDIGVDLNGKACKEQFNRYKQSLNNIIFTDYLDFHRYVNGELAGSVRIAEIKNGKITPVKTKFTHFEQLFIGFGTAQPQNITSPAEIARMMAAKARLMAENIELSLKNKDGDLTGVMDAFKQVLIHDITHKEFADVYAQTIAYGLFAARLHDDSPDTFNRQKAASLIPKTNPFLRQLFQNIAGFDLDDRICWIVDDLAETFRVANMFHFKESLGKHTPQNDPMIHFYENFLSEYDPALRKSRGVWYTPQPVVSFIVRAVDEILQKEFNLPDGLADTSKTKVQVIGQSGKTEAIDMHKVQILDPATGTGTFLAETVNRIHDKYKNQAGVWQSYVKEHLIPRLNGFEILMASYTMAHIKLEYLLSQTSYEPADNQRLRIYLTNSLEKYHQETGTPFARFLAHEANGASEIKRDAPIMVVMGNPPYNVSTQNRNEWIQDLIADYKKGLDERKINLDDDYIKFIRYGQHYIEKNKVGILAYISNNSFIDGVTHRQMRMSLLTAFDKIYILDLHGSAKKKETALDGSKDENVFDIQQGVSINIFVKTGKKKNGKLAQVFHSDLYGIREGKYAFLINNTMKTIKWERVENKSPYFFFVHRTEDNKEEYEKGFGVQELFPVYVSGFQTKRDKITTHFSKAELAEIKQVFLNEEIPLIRTALRLPADGRDWSVKDAQKDLKENRPQTIKVMYRPFDERFTYFTGKAKGFVAYPRAEMAAHLSKEDNISLITCRQQSTFNFQHVFISRLLSDMCGISSQTKETGYMFPLYLYSANPLPDEPIRTPNLNKDIVAKISTGTGLRFTNEDNGLSKAFAPLDLFDYIYAVLHSPAYREKYGEFLKINFPRVPYPESAKQFRALAKTGEKLRRLHLLDGVEPMDGVADFQIPGSDVVENIQYEPGKADGRVYINNTQYFGNIPAVAWEFYIGGYQPAQKWLKDRKGRTLEFGDIQHYRRVIRVLAETAKIMGEIGNGNMPNDGSDC
jgi:hypothetical protein